MTKFKVLGAICLAATLAAASPALARPGHVGGMRGAAHFAGGGGAWHGGGFRRGGGIGAGIAAGVVAGAVLGGGYGYYGGDPGYYGDSYAYDPGSGYDTGYYNNGYNGPQNNYYNNNPNGFVCQPGTVFKGEDGRPHLCQ
jgi:hypothetical protein